MRRFVKPERDVTSWNAEVSVGAPVFYKKDDGSIIETHTRTEASVLSGHTAVVWLEGVRGCVDLSRVSVRER